MMELHWRFLGTSIPYFNKLYDAQVRLLPLTGTAGDLSRVHILSAIPERNLDEATRMKVTKTTPTYNDDGELELKLEFQAAAGSKH